MNPDNNQLPNSQYPIDYLNQIAPQAKKSGPSNRILVLVVIIGAVLALIVGFIMLMSSGSGPTNASQTLAARLQTLQTVSDKSQKNIKSSALRGINSNLKIFLTSANRDIAAPLSETGIDVKALDKSIVAKESGTELSESLENARLNANFDNTYAREMSFQLATLDAVMGDIYAKTKNEDLKTFLVTTNDNLQPIKKQLDEFNNTSS